MFLKNFTLVVYSHRQKYIYLEYSLIDKRIKHGHTWLTIKMKMINKMLRCCSNLLNIFCVSVCFLFVYGLHAVSG